MNDGDQQYENHGNAVAVQQFRTFPDEQQGTETAQVRRQPQHELRITKREQLAAQPHVTDRPESVLVEATRFQQHCPPGFIGPQVERADQHAP